MKFMRKEKIARPELVDHLEQVFEASLQLYERYIQINNAGTKRVFV